MNTKFAISGGILIGVIVVITGMVLALRFWHTDDTSIRAGRKGETILEMHAAGISRFLSIKPGMSERTVRSVLGAQLFSECLFDDHGVAVRIFSPYVAPDGRTAQKYADDWAFFWLIFRQGRFDKIVEPVQGPVAEVPYQDTTIERPKLLPITDQSRMLAAVRESPLTVAQIEREVNAPNPYQNHWSWNVLPAAIIVALMGGGSEHAREQAELLERTKLAAKYDTSAITLGMTPGQIAAAFGKPLHVWNLGGNKMAAIYGAQKYFSESPYWNSTRFAVIYVGGKVHTVLADSFYDDRWCHNPDAGSPVKTEDHK